MPVMAFQQDARKKYIYDPLELAAFGEQSARSGPGFSDVYRLRPVDLQPHSTGSYHPVSRRKLCPSQKGPATPRVKAMHDLASVCRCPCTLALAAVINQCPFGAHTQLTVQGLWPSREALKDRWLFTTLLAPCESKGIL